MGCCKCEEKIIGWADPQPVVYVDPADKQEYCVFHAPKDEKRKALGSEERYTVEEFNDVVFARIDAVKERVQAGDKVAQCDLRHTVFLGDVDFTRYGPGNPLPPIDFYGGMFSGTAGFLGVTFSGNAWFTGARFSGEAGYDRARFSGAVGFDKATFSSEAGFDKATFSSEAEFSEATFSGNAGFSEATFSGAVGFDRATFSGNAGFSEARFSGAVGFREATFHGKVRFQGAFFNREAGFREATFSGKAEFREATTKENWRVVVQGMQPDSLKHLKFTRAELEAPLFSFVNCVWPDRLGLEVHGEGGAANLLECENLYRAMKKRATDEHDQRMVSVWHYREKLMALLRLLGFGPVRAALRLWRRLGERELIELSRLIRLVLYCSVLLASSALFLLSAPRALFSLSFWYWATSGFGERMGRAGVVLAVLAVLPFLLFGPVGAALLPGFQAGANATAAPGLVGGFFAATNATAAMQFIPFTKDIGGEGWMKVAQGVWHVLVIVQATLFALAVRNRFRR